MTFVKLTLFGGKPVLVNLERVSDIRAYTSRSGPDGTSITFAEVPESPEGGVLGWTLVRDDFETVAALVFRLQDRQEAGRG
jgi:hypothetical protein